FKIVPFRYKPTATKGFFASIWAKKTTYQSNSFFIHNSLFAFQILYLFQKKSFLKTFTLV
ncbi:hypothetical protein B0A77_14610, partial [Flavobacterium branchiophilum]